MKHRTRRVCHVRAELINPKPAKLNAPNVQIFLDAPALRSDRALARREIAKSVVQLESISTQTPVSADRADMDSSNPTKVRSTARFADWDKPRDPPKPSQEESAVMSARQECSLESTASASHAREELSVPKESNRHATLVLWDERPRRSVQRLLKNVLCQFARQELISTPQSMSVLNVARDITNRSRNKLHASPARPTTAPRTLPQRQRLSAQTPAKLPLRVINIAMQTLIAFSFLKPQTSSANASLALTALALIV